MEDGNFFEKISKVKLFGFRNENDRMWPPSCEVLTVTDCVKYFIIDVY